MIEADNPEQGKKYTITWFPAPFIPPRELTIQSSGLCFTKNHQLVLVHDGKNWMLPGGSPGKNETLEQALIREIAEEACAMVIQFHYLGSIQYHDVTPGAVNKNPVFYKARYWVKVINKTFHPRFEIKERIEIPPEQFIHMLSWNAKKTAEIILKEALAIENKR
ncbi:MAG: NUDIX domain-containing protein [Spirochaetales bacterium]|nr:NUDIX domain-containing protein [Spirochaetales bacterium]